MVAFVPEVVRRRAFLNGIFQDCPRRVFLMWWRNFCSKKDISMILLADVLRVDDMSSEIFSNRTSNDYLNDYLNLEYTTEVSCVISLLVNDDQRYMKQS